MKVENFFEKLDNLFVSKQIDQVEPFIKEVLDEAEAEKDYGLVIAGCNELGGLYRALSRYEEGIELYQKAIAYLEELGA